MFTWKALIQHVRSGKAIKVKTDRSPLEKAFVVFIYVFSGAFALACFLPFWLVFINSLAKESAIKVHGYQLNSEGILPECVSVRPARQADREQLSRIYDRDRRRHGSGGADYRDVRLRTGSSQGEVPERLILPDLFTMIFGAGLVGFYILNRDWLHLKDCYRC